MKSLETYFSSGMCAIFNSWFMVSAHASSYGCTREVATHEKSARVACICTRRSRGATLASWLACVHKIIEYADDVGKFLGSNCVS